METTIVDEVKESTKLNSPFHYTNSSPCKPLKGVRGVHSLHLYGSCECVCVDFIFLILFFSCKYVKMLVKFLRYLSGHIFVLHTFVYNDVGWVYVMLCYVCV